MYCDIIFGKYYIKAGHMAAQRGNSGARAVHNSWRARGAGALFVPRYLMILILLHVSFEVTYSSESSESTGSIFPLGSFAPAS